MRFQCTATHTPCTAFFTLLTKRSLCSDLFLSDHQRVNWRRIARQQVVKEDVPRCWVLTARIRGADIPLASQSDRLTIVYVWSDGRSIGIWPPIARALASVACVQLSDNTTVRQTIVYVHPCIVRATVTNTGWSRERNAIRLVYFSWQAWYLSRCQWRIL